MVDLHQTEPGLPEGHPWQTLPRMHMAWRTGFSVALVGMAGVVASAFVTMGASGANLIGTAGSYIFAAVIPTLCAVLAAILGPWLKRYYPFSQVLIFGFLAVTAVVVMTAVASIVAWFLSGPCEPNTYCGSPIDGMYWAVMLLALPTFLEASVGYGLAIWSPTRRGVRAFWPLFAVAGIAFAIAVFLGSSGLPR